MIQGTSKDNDVIIVEEHIEKPKRRKYELLGAFALCMAACVATWLQLAFYGVDSWIFIALLNLNVLFMLIAVFLVARNAIKLFMERRRKVFGARMRTRLVVIFVSLSLLPAVIMFLASNRIVATTVDYWFTNQTESSLQSALAVGRSFYTAAADRLRSHSENIVTAISGNNMVWGGEAMNALLDEKQEEYALITLAMIAPDGTPVSWHATPDFNEEWEDIRESINWTHAATNRFSSLLWTTDTADYVIGVLGVDGGRTGYLLSAESIGRGLMAQLDRISQGFEEYAYLKQLKNPLKLSFLMILGILGLVTIFGSIWLGFRLSKQISAPILALAEGTNRIAKGDLNFRLEDEGKDELGLLVRSFNSMAIDLQQSRERLTQVNEMLARRNAMVAEHNAYIETVLDSIATGVVTLDAEGRIVTMNKAAASIFHTQPRRVVGLNPLTLLAPLHAEHFSAMLDALRARPDEHWIRQVDISLGERLLKLVIHAVALEGKDGIRAFLVAIEDVTDLEKMQRMAAWREVARRIAHEIKNPLTPIKLSAERLKRRFGSKIDDPVFGQCTELIVTQVERMQHMVEEFSSFAKLPEIDLKPNDLPPLLEEAVGLFRTSHGVYAWNLDIAAPLPPIAMDTEALYRVLINLFTNAADALAAKAVSAPPDWRGRVGLSASHDQGNDMVVLLIEDNGPGLTPAERERIFEPYYSNKPGGTGLGLAIVRSIILDHGGEITVASAPDGGTAFTLRFPVYSPARDV